jgi:hypothetical protein
MCHYLRDQLGRPRRQRLQVAIGAPDKSLNVPQHPFAITRRDGVVAERAEIVRKG